MKDVDCLLLALLELVPFIATVLEVVEGKFLYCKAPKRRAREKVFLLRKLFSNYYLLIQCGYVPHIIEDPASILVHSQLAEAALKQVQIV